MFYNLMNSFENWVKQYVPVSCASCQKIVFAKNARYRELLTGKIVPLCTECDDNIFGGTRTNDDD